MLKFLFDNLLYQPLFNILIAFYKLFGDLGIAIILLTIFIKTILFPLTKKQAISQQQIKNLQPKINEIKEKLKDNKEEQGKEVLALYKKENINPAMGCLIALVQLPILFALYRVLIPGGALALVDGHLIVTQDLLYNLPFLQGITEIKTTFLGIVDLTQKNFFLAVLSGALQFVYSKQIMPPAKKKDPAAKNSQEPEFQDVLSSQMLYVMPIMAFVFALGFPAGLPFYWSVSTLVSIFQQFFIKKTLSKTHKERE